MWRLHVHMHVWCMSHVYHALSTTLLKVATCMHAKQLIGTDVAAFAWHTHALPSHPRVIGIASNLQMQCPLVCM